MIKTQNVIKNNISTNTTLSTCNYTYSFYKLCKVYLHYYWWGMHTVHNLKHEADKNIIIVIHAT